MNYKCDKKHCLKSRSDYFTMVRAEQNCDFNLNELHLDFTLVYFADNVYPND